MKKVTLLLLITVLMISCLPISVLSETYSTMALRENNVVLYLTLNGNTAKASATMILFEGYTSVTTLTLQQQENGGWSDIVSWTSSEREFSKTTSISKGTYRLSATSIIYNGNTYVDTIYRTSGNKTYK